MRIRRNSLLVGLTVGVSISMGCADAEGVDRICDEVRCDDRNECTDDVCDPTDPRVCVFVPVSADTSCAGDQWCDGAGACVECNRDEQCPPSLDDCASPRCEGGACGATPKADGTLCAGGECQDGMCTLDGAVLPCTEHGVRNAIAAGGGPYTFDCDGPTTVSTNAEIVIGNSVVLDGGGNLVVDGNGDHRVFSVSDGVLVELRNLGVTGGVATRDIDEQSCGGLSNQGVLTLTNVTVSENEATSGGGGGLCNSGLLTVERSTVADNEARACAGIFNNGLLALTDSTVTANQAEAGGGGICNSARLTLMRSTVSGNQADFTGGIESSGILEVTNSTVSGNISRGGAGGVFNVGSGTLTHTSVSGNTIGGEPGDIRSTGTLTIGRSLIDGGCVGESGGIQSDGYNIESPGNTCGFDEPTDIADVPAQALALGPLTENGGPTATHSLQEGSDAIDRVPPEACDVTEDQRGVGRPQGDSCDVGAFERQTSDLAM